MAGISIRIAVAFICVSATIAGSPVKADPFVQNMSNSGVQGPSSTLEALPPTIDYSITVTNPKSCRLRGVGLRLVTGLFSSLTFEGRFGIPEGGNV